MFSLPILAIMQRKEALLKGNLDFTSHYTDVNQIMDLFSGMGDTTLVAEETMTDTVAKEDNPFIVPLGIDITLNTNIEKAVAGGRVGDIGAAIAKYCEDRGFSVVREFIGHGIGKSKKAAEQHAAKEALELMGQ